MRRFFSGLAFILLHLFHADNLQGAIPLTNPPLNKDFVRATPTGFSISGKPYKFLGINFWYGPHLASEVRNGDRARLVRELNRLQDLGISNLRILALSEGPDTQPWRMRPSSHPQPSVLDEDHMRGLDFLLLEMNKRQMKAVLMLSNFWPWSGGFSQYVSWFERLPIPYPPPEPNGSWLTFQNFAAKFYLNSSAQKLYLKLVRTLIERRNSYSHIQYRDDPTIMAWELANEPRGDHYPQEFNAWIKKSSQLIKDLDSNHLVTVGMEGNTPSPVGNDFLSNHRHDSIDYTTIHIWVENWGWYDPQKPSRTYDRALAKFRNYLLKHLKISESLRKPLVLEEFGLARDHRSLDPYSKTLWRDRFFEDVFSLVHSLQSSARSLAGLNLWSWAGEGRPVGQYWQTDNPWTGDPPHEDQGWYGIYDTDDSTNDLIKKWQTRLKGP